MAGNIFIKRNVIWLLSALHTFFFFLREREFSHSCHGNSWNYNPSLSSHSWNVGIELEFMHACVCMAWIVLFIAKYIHFFDARLDYYASPLSWEAYSNRQLTPYFELWFFFLCRHVSINSCLSVRQSVCIPRKEITLASSISVLQ